MPPTPGRASSLRSLLLLAVVAVALIGPHVGRRVIASSDEARFPLLARDMLERGTWFEAYVREKQYRNKPPLLPWAIAGLSREPHGITGTTAQAPVAVAAVVTVLFTFLMGEALFARRAAVWAALVLLTSFGFFGHSHRVLPDMLVACFATASGWAFARATIASPAPARRWIVVFWIAIGLATFAKGPLGVVPVLVAAIWLWLEGGPAALRRLASPLGLAAFAAITAAWVVPFLMLGGQSFAGRVVWGNWLTWFLGVPRPAGVANFLLDALEGFLPWSFLVPVVARPAAAAWRDRAVKLALLWSLVPLTMMALSANPMERYSLAAFPGAALVVGWWADRHGAATTRAGGVAAWIVLGLTVAAAVVGVAGAPRFDLDWVPGDRLLALPLGFALAAVGASIFVGLRHGRPRVLVVGTVTAMLLGLSYGMWSAADRFNVRNDFPAVAAMLERHAHGGESRVLGGRYFQVELYLGRSLPRLWTVEELNEFVLRPGRPVVLADERAWSSVKDHVPPGVKVLDRIVVRRRELLVIGAR